MTFDSIGFLCVLAVGVVTREPISALLSCKLRSIGHLEATDMTIFLARFVTYVGSRADPSDRESGPEQGSNRCVTGR
jgi:hypothetical protein